MKTLTLRDGSTIPAIGLGTWQAEPGVVGEAVGEALRIGYRHVDCARIYMNEQEIGDALAASFGSGVVTRDELFVTSKLWNDEHRPEDVRTACERTLSELRLDHLDLYLMHWPVALKKGRLRPESADDLVPLEECPLADTWAAMEDLVDAGLCRHLGVSNFAPGKLRDLHAGARIAPVMNQVEMHPYLQQRDLLGTAAGLGILLTAYSPLGSPARPDGMRRADEPVLLEDPVVGGIAEKHGATPAQVLIAWAVARGTAVIPKTVRPERLRLNLEAADVELDADDLEVLGGLDRSARYIDGSFWAMEGSPYTLEWLWETGARS